MRGAASQSCTATDAGHPLIPRPMRSFGEALTTAAKASPSEREALGLSNARATSTRHPLFLSGASIRRRLLHPQRRKSSIIWRPLEAGFSCSHWSIFSMTTLRPSWRSTVS